MTEHDEEELWRSIVENYGDRISLELPAEAPAEANADVTTEQDADGRDPRGRDEPDLLDASDDPEEHFVPPDPPPLSAPEPRRLLAWLGVFGVPLLVVVVSVLQVHVPSFVSLLCLVWFLGGFGYLVATMRSGDDQDGWDDGAVL